MPMAAQGHLPAPAAGPVPRAAGAGGGSAPQLPTSRCLGLAGWLACPQTVPAFHRLGMRSVTPPARLPLPPRLTSASRRARLAAPQDVRGLPRSHQRRRRGQGQRPRPAEPGAPGACRRRQRVDSVRTLACGWAGTRARWRVGRPAATLTRLSPALPCPAPVCVSEQDLVRKAFADKEAGKKSGGGAPKVGCTAAGWHGCGRGPWRVACELCTMWSRAALGCAVLRRAVLAALRRAVLRRSAPCCAVLRCAALVCGGMEGQCGGKCHWHPGPRPPAHLQRPRAPRKSGKKKKEEEEDSEEEEAAGGLAGAGWKGRVAWLGGWRALAW